MTAEIPAPVNDGGLSMSLPRPKTALWSRSLLLMVVLTIVTLWLYVPIWYIRRRKALNQLDSPRKLDAWPFLLFLAFWIFSFLVGMIEGASPHSNHQGLDLFVGLTRLAIGILIIVQSFRVKDILEDHLAGPGDQVRRGFGEQEVKLSALLTFFFSIFYLQYTINHRILA